MQTIKLGLALAALATLSTGCGTKQGENTSEARAFNEVEEVKGTVKTCHDGDTCNVILEDG